MNFMCVCGADCVGCATVCLGLSQCVHCHAYDAGTKYKTSVSVVCVYAGVSTHMHVWSQVVVGVHVCVSHMYPIKGEGK